MSTRRHRGSSNLHFFFPIAALLTLVCVSVAAAPGTPPARTTSVTPWNFIVILVDDLGWTDLGCQGSKFYETPNIDRLAAEGLRFTQAYSTCTVCSPTRASLLTGQYPARLHITDWIAGHVRPKARLRVPDWTMHLPREVWNLGRRFHDADYATASIGKWHLGGPDYYPDRQGFDENIGGTDRGQPPSYVAPYKIATLPEGPPGEFLTDRECSEAIRFLERNRERPFFLYLPHYAVHTPIAGKPEVIEKYRRKARPGEPHRNPTYAALVESVDDSVGRLRHRLAELGLSDRTVILFTSDNGGLLGAPRNPITSNVPLRAGKGSAYEGGVRVPLLVLWPGRTVPGSLCETPIITADIFPTLCDIAGWPVPASHIVDGESLVPLLTGKGTLRRQAIFWHYPHYHPGGATPYGAVRKGDLKLIEFYEDKHRELYDLGADVGEQHDLASTRPEEVADLAAELDAWRKRVGAQMPSPNPDYAPGSE